MSGDEQCDRLAAVLRREAQEAFEQMLGRVAGERPYGFALYTDDSATGVDAAMNTLEQFQRRADEPRADRFEVYWYTIEWGCEGGVAEVFAESTRILDEMTPDMDDAPVYDEFRETVFTAMIRALADLSESGFFTRAVPDGETLLQVAVTDSDDDERIMDSSIRSLNPASVYDAFIRQKDDSGH